eukprot:6209380-Pyramimonas_sp.AAC.1
MQGIEGRGTGMRDNSGASEQGHSGHVWTRQEITHPGPTWMQMPKLPAGGLQEGFGNKASGPLEDVRNKISGPLEDLRNKRTHHRFQTTL